MERDIRSCQNLLLKKIQLPIEADLKIQLQKIIPCFSIWIEFQVVVAGG